MSDNYSNDNREYGYYEDYENIEFNHVDRQKKTRKKKNYLLRFLALAGVFAAIGLFLSSSIFDVKTIEVEGNSYYSDSQVINISGAVTGGNIIWGTESGTIKERLREDPYFTEVKVKRKLPDTLIIQVQERTQIAAVIYGDKYIVIDPTGIVLRKGDVDPKITLIKGLKISKMDVGEHIGVEKEQILETTLDMLSVMREGDLYFKKIDVSKVTIKAYIFDTLLVKGTPKQMKKTIKSGELQKVVNMFIKNNMKRGTLNLGDNGYMSFSPTF